MPKILSVTVLLLCALTASLHSNALSGDPDIHMQCDEPETFSIFKKVQCRVGSAPYIPPTAQWDYPIAFLMPQSEGPHRVKVKLSGYNARPYAFCTGLDFAKDGFITIKPCAGHYPDLGMHTVDGIRPHGWWGWFRGPSNSYRIGLALTKAADSFNGNMQAGIHLEGTSYGGTGVILQSMLLRHWDPWWSQLIAVVHAQVPHTLFVKNWLNYLPVDVAWTGLKRSLADVATQMANGSLDNIYYRINGSPADSSVIFDTEFFRLCDRYEIACFGTWHNAGHNLTEPGVDLPFNALYASDEMDVRRDRMLPVFTASTANHWGPQRGHYNLGLSWHAGTYFIDSEERVLVPVRYRAHRNIGGGIPDQPDTVTFNLTVRRIEHFKATAGSTVNWSLGGYGSGQVTVERAGEITIEGLTLHDSENYTGLQFTLADSNNG